MSGGNERAAADPAGDAVSCSLPLPPPCSSPGLRSARCQRPVSQSGVATTEDETDMVSDDSKCLVTRGSCALRDHRLELDWAAAGLDIAASMSIAGDGVGRQRFSVRA